MIKQKPIFNLIDCVVKLILLMKLCGYDNLDRFLLEKVEMILVGVIYSVWIYVVLFYVLVYQLWFSFLSFFILIL